MGTHIEIGLGFGSPTVREAAAKAGIGISERISTKFEVWREAVRMLRYNSLITDGELDKIMKRYMTQLVKDIEEEGKL